MKISLRQQLYKVITLLRKAGYKVETKIDKSEHYWIIKYK